VISSAPRLSTDEARRIFDRFAVIKDRASFSEIAVVAGRIRHLPCVNNLALNVDEINLASATLRSEQSKARPGAVVIAGA
jgi:hypothetical protein